MSYDSMSEFARTIMEQKYSHILKDGTKENWNNIAYRVTKNVMKAVGYDMRSHLCKEIHEAIRDRKFIPGGRYLASSGRPYHQISNCVLLRAEDSREGWADLLYRSSMALMTGAGIGIVYSDVRGKNKKIRKTGGVSTGPIALMQMINECGRGIVQGGSRRSAVLALLHWNHADIFDFIHLKDWSEEVKALKARDYNFPAPLDGTNISVILDTQFFEAYHDDKHPLHSHARTVYWGAVKQMLKTGEPGFSVDCGKNEGENLRNACVIGETEILTDNGYQRIDELVGKEVNIWNGFEWSKVTPKQTGSNLPVLKITFSSGQSIICTHDHKFVIAKDYDGNTVRTNASNLRIDDKIIKCNFPILPEGKQSPYAYSQGFYSAEGLHDSDLVYIYEPKEMCIDRLDIRLLSKEKNNKRYRAYLNFDVHSKNFVPFRWNLQSKLDWLAGWFDGDGTELREGGCQAGSIDKEFLLNVQKMLSTVGIASKVTKAKDAGYREMPGGTYFCQEFYRLLIGAVQMQELKEMGLQCERMPFNKSPQRDASQFSFVTSIKDAGIADKVYCFNEPKNHTGIFNGLITGQCSEVSSYDDSDQCNLASINMSRISSLEEMEHIVEIAIAFLLAGTVYSDVPYSLIDRVRTKNRRLGLGLMGLHEWLLLHNKKYGPDDELEKYLKVYTYSDKYARQYAKEWDLSTPKKTRAIAPNGSIGILAESTTSIEPIYCVAYKRRYMKGTTVHYQYVVDPTAKRLIEHGVPAEQIEDAYTLAEDVERRVAFQAWVQQYVDHCISSTINLPAWGSPLNNDGTVQSFGNMLMNYLPKLRGITCYPDGARSGQPLTPVKYSTAMKHLGEVFLEAADVCSITGKGTCDI